MARSVTLLSVLLLSVASIQGCASTQATAAAHGALSHQPGLLSRTELTTQRGRKLGDAIRMLDAGILTSRGEPLQVWIDGASYSIDRLEALSADDVLEVRKLSAADARQMFGDRASGAGLLVRTRMR